MCSLLQSCLFLLILKSIDCSDNDYFTSPAAIHKLVKVEQHLLAAFTEYASLLEKRMEKVKNYLEDYEQSIMAGVTRPGGESNTNKIKVYDNQAELVQLSIEVSSHPLMTYRLIRRFAIQLQEFERDLGNQHEKKILNLMEKTRKGIRLPQSSDVRGSIEGLLRVQDAYDLNITQFTKGNFQGLDTNSGLTANDCYQVGMYALEAQIHTRSIEWLQRAYRLATQENDPTISTEKIIEALVDAVAQHDETQLQEPANIYVYRQPLGNVQPLLSDTNDLGLEKPSAQRQYVLYREQENIMDLYNFAALCSGKQLQPPGHSKVLKCFYQSSRGIPFSTEKVEYLHLNPTVYQVHDVVSEWVMDRIIQLATPSMIRSKVQGITADEYHSTTRTSTSAWIQESAHAELKTLPSRIARITGLNLTRLSGAEDLQISSYGIGGHYNPHLDVLFEDYPPGTDEKRKGDRIATFLIYLSEVGRGGATAFPRLGIVAQPVKGSAIFWFNLRSDGSTDPLSLHGGCPVLYGTKHVANKWIRANAQFQTRKCELQ